MTDETKGTGVDLADLAQPANAERAVPEEARRAPQPEATTSSPMPPAAEVHSPDHGEAAGPEEPSRVVSALEAVFDVPVGVAAVLGKTNIEVSSLLALGEGDIVQLDRKVGEAIDIFINDRLIARGEVVLVEDRLGVTMTEIIKGDQSG